MAFSNLTEQIENTTGKFSLDKQYFINNITNEDIVVTWAAREPEARGSGTYHIKAGEKGGPYPQFLAYHIVKALVNREMQKDGKSNLFGSAAARDPYEKKYLHEIEGSVEDPFVAQIREEERKKVLNELKNSAISDGGLTSSETRRKALGKKGAVEEEFEGANRE